MHFAKKLIKGDDFRKSRFHTMNDKLCLAPDQILIALSTTILRHLTGYLIPRPWIAIKAVRFLAARDWSRAIAFEYSVGMSTIWYSKKFRQLYAVEHDSEWYNKVDSKLSDRKNVKILLEDRKEKYISSIGTFGVEKFDFISIDGRYRSECFHESVSYLSKGGVLLIDNTDAHPEIEGQLDKYFSKDKILKFNGFTTGNFHPQETAICIGS